MMSQDYKVGDRVTVAKVHRLHCDKTKSLKGESGVIEEVIRTSGWEYLILFDCNIYPKRWWWKQKWLKHERNNH